jgi:hypothetical protein
MRRLSVMLVGVVLVALWPAAAPVFADDAPNTWVTRCRPGPVFVPGQSLGFVALGVAVTTVQGRYGRPRSVQALDFGGHHWQHLLFDALTVLARDNVVVAVTMPQAASLPVDTDCGTLASVPFSLPVTVATQTYGAAPASLTVNGLRYALYNALGLLFASPPAGSAVQWLTVYPAGQYCSIAPVLVSFGRIAAGVSTMGQCASDAGHEHE